MGGEIMKEMDAARRFDRQVDLILARARRVEPSDVVPMGCAGDVGMAQELASSDLTGGSAVFASLRNGVPFRTARPAPTIRRGEIFLSKIMRPFPAAIAAVVLAVVLVQCTYPGGVPGLTKEIQASIVDEMSIGPHTSVVQNSSDPEVMAKAVAAIPKEIKDRMWYIGTSAMGFGGGTPDGVSTAVSRFDSYDAARGPAGMRITVPRYIPAGFTLRDVFVPPGGRNVVAVYTDAGTPASDIAIWEASVGVTDVKAAASGMSMTGTSVSVGGDGPYQVVDLDGVKAAWIPGSGSLVWESAGVSYTIAGRLLTFEQAKLIWQGMQ
jgi:hypothetical protein